MSLILSFDIGYASIGWCVLDGKDKAPALPEILGTGVVTFPTDDCLASKRRDLRRTRRHIRSTRQRIERMKRWLVHRGVLGREDLDKPGHPAPFLLAAAALQGHRELNAWELWTVLRWYAHNRGYDGNSRWANDEEETEDTEKVIAANNLMEKHGTGTMCETVCKCLELDPAKSRKTISSHLPYKTLNAAYPRGGVVEEVCKLLSKHRGKITGLDAETVRFLMKGTDLTKEERVKLEVAGIKLPKRYTGGLLFGQLVPRFDNRIIARCPITWAKTHDEALDQGKTADEARKLADKFAKVPAAKCREFLEYRFARILANIKADGQPLDAELRADLWKLAQKQGRLTHSDIEKAIKGYCGDVITNIDAYFKLHPKSEEALVLDPAMDEVRKAKSSPQSTLAPVWKHLPESARDEAITQWKKGRSISLAWFLDQSKESPGHESIEAALLKKFEGLKPKKGQPRYKAFGEYLLRTKIEPEIPSGRAPYARPVLKRVKDEVMSGWDPTKADKQTDPEKGEDKPANGVLYDLGIPGSRVRQLQNERPLDKLTNNHLVRHRLLILERLLDDLAEEFVSRDRPVSRVVVEVARELGKFSGMTAKEIAAELNNRLKDFKSAVALLEKAKEEIPEIEINASIIRKCRIAMDLDWKCPFTGEPYGPDALKHMEREHIIPYATRNTNALHALVLTRPEINRMKGKRTARQFIEEDGGKAVPGREKLSLFGLRQYDEFVEKLDTKGHPDDGRRKRARKALLATTSFEDKELGFSDGDLTKTSHLMKLAMRGLSIRFPEAACDPVPGPITAEIRKAWNIFGTLALVCPEAIDPISGKALRKEDIRGLTHMHHALDAATIALAAYYFPLQAHGRDQKGAIWQALVKRSRTEEDKRFLLSLGCFKAIPSNGRPGTDVVLLDLPAALKNSLSRSLAECRVAQHMPADRSGLPADSNPWGFHGWDEEGRAKLRQRTFVENDKPQLRPDMSRIYQDKSPKAGANSKDRVFGAEPRNGSGKLKATGSVILLNQNYGLLMGPEPTLIPFKHVHETLEKIKKTSGNKTLTILRSGALVRIKGHGPRDGIWRVDTIQATDLKIDLIKAHLTSMKETVVLPNGKTKKRNRKGDQVWRERPFSLLHDPANGKFVELLPRRYSGYPHD